MSEFVFVLNSVACHHQKTDQTEEQINRNGNGHTKRNAKDKKKTSSEISPYEYWHRSQLVWIYFITMMLLSVVISNKSNSIERHKVKWQLEAVCVRPSVHPSIHTFFIHNSHRIVFHLKNIIEFCHDGNLLCVLCPALTVPLFYISHPIHPLGIHSKSATQWFEMFQDIVQVVHSALAY